MIIIDRIKEFLSSLELREFYYYVAGGITLIIGIMGFILYSHYNTIKTMKKRIALINQQRTTAQEILTKFERVKEQKAALISILEKDKAFKIAGDFEKLATQLNLSANITAPLSPVTEDLENLPEYREVRLLISLANINMRQLTELLKELEKKERIYTKELEITKPLGRQTIDVALTIATLQPRTESMSAE